MKNKNMIWFAAVMGASMFAVEAKAQSLWKPDSRFASLIEDRTARRLGDTITIVVSEQQSVADKNNAKIERTSNFSATPNTVKLSTHSPISLPGIDIDSSRKMDAKADAQKQGSFSTTITGTVIDVQPNGNLVVTGRRRILVDNDEKTLEIIGIVRPYDIAASNTIQSAQMADARITFVGDGPIAEATKKGWLARGFEVFWNFVWPF